MTVSPPPPPSPRPPSREPLGFDELIGILVAFLAIGSIFFWSITRPDGGLALFDPQLSEEETEATEEAPFSLFQEQEIEEEPAELEMEERPILRAEREETVVERPLTDPVREAQTGVATVPFAVPGIAEIEEEGEPEPIPTATPLNFSDVPDDFWAEPFITALSARRIVNGFPGGYFRPDQPVTRAEFAAMLEAAFGDRADIRETEPFEDVPEGFWAVPAIQKAYRTGFMEGYPGDVFRPELQIPKVQALVALASGLDLPTPENPAQVLQVYPNAAEVPDYAREQLAAATEAGLVVKSPNQAEFNPTQDATRAEIAAFIYQALVEAGRAEPLNSGYEVQP